MKRTRLKSKDINKQLGLELSKKDQVELVEDEFKILFINRQPAFFYYENKLVPTLKYLQSHQVLKKITVDMGAVKFIVNGADIMRPGIIEIENKINKNDFILIIDVNNKKPLAVGIALFETEEMRKTESGKVIKNIHYVGDKIWKFE